jgi:hypothetical protein
MKYLISVVLAGAGIIIAILSAVGHAFVGYFVAVVLLIVAAIMAVVTTRREREKEKASRGPQPCLEYSSQHAGQHVNYSGLFVRNCGEKAAFKITLGCEPVGKLRLRFEDMPIQRIDPGKSSPVQVHTEQLADNGLWYPIGGTLGMQIESFFERLDSDTGVSGDLVVDTEEEQRISITIRFADYEATREHTTRWFIVRKGSVLLPKHIYCEAASGAASTS